MWSKIKETIGNAKSLQQLKRDATANYVVRDPVYLTTPDGKSKVKLERRPRSKQDQARDIKSLLDRIFADGEITLQEYITLMRRVGESKQEKNGDDALIKKLYVRVFESDTFRDRKHTHISGTHRRVRRRTTNESIERSKGCSCGREQSITCTFCQEDVEKKYVTVKTCIVDHPNDKGQSRTVNRRRNKSG